MASKNRAAIGVWDLASEPFTIDSAVLPYLGRLDCGREAREAVGAAEQARQRVYSALEPGMRNGTLYLSNVPYDGIKAARHGIDELTAASGKVEGILENCLGHFSELSKEDAADALQALAAERNRMGNMIANYRALRREVSVQRDSNYKNGRR